MVQWKGFTGRKESVKFLGQKVNLTCCESMAGIQTHPHPGLVPHFVYDALQLREVTAHRRALATHVLQHWPHWGGTEKRPPSLLGLTHRTRRPQHLIHGQSWLCLHLFIPEAQSGALFFLPPPSVCFLRHSGVQCILVIQVAFAVCESNRL